MTNTITLTGINAKLARAETNLGCFYGEWERFLREKPYRFPGQFEAQESAYVFRAQFLKEPPTMIGVILGEFVHNLRSTLDQLVWQLALLNGIEPSGTQFPIVSAHKGWPTRRVEGWIKGVSSKHGAIIESFQPYHPGREPLKWLGDLSNVDKHRVVHPSGIAVKPGVVDPGFRLTANDDAGYGGEIILHHDRLLENGAEVVCAPCKPVGPAPQMYMDGEPAIQPAFGLPQPLLYRGLDRIQGMVVEIIDAFRPDFPSSGSNPSIPK